MINREFEGFPKVTVQAESLVIADLKRDVMEGQIAACILQGIVNRDAKEKIWVENTRCYDNHGNWNIVSTEPCARMAYVAEQWRKNCYDDLPYVELIPCDVPEFPVFISLFRKYREHVKGYVIYDLRLPDATIEAATTICGQTDAIALSPRLYQILKEKEGADLPVVEDLRSYCFRDNVAVMRWLKKKYFAGANKTVQFTWSHMDLSPYSWGTANKDYVVANRLFTYYLNIEDETERTYYGEIVNEYPMGTPIIGWTNELVADQMFARMGYFMIPFISVENTSVTSSFPSVDLPMPEVTAPEFDPEAVYITFHVADGDNLLHSLVYQPFTMANDPAFGAVPATWIQNPILSELAPRNMAWYRKILEEAGQESGCMIGDGSPSSESYEGFSFYCRFVRRYMDRAGMRTQKQMLDGEPVAYNVKPDVLIGGYSGIDSRGIRPYEYHMDENTFHIGSVPLGEVDVTEIIRKAPGDRPLFLCVYSGTASEQVCSRIAAYAKEWREQLPDRKLCFVTAAQAGELFRKYSERIGKTGR